MVITFGRPCKANLKQCRGLETPDINLLIILVKESVESSAGAYSSLKPINIWEKNTYNQEIAIHQESTFVFKLQGHLWSIIYKPLLPLKSFLLPEDAKALSTILNTDTIYYECIDTANIIHYQLFKNGILVEKLYYENGTAEFISQRRQIDVNKIRRYRFVNDFIQEQDTYIPMLICDYPRDEKKFIRGKRTILNFENLFPSEVARMDYLAKN